MSSKKGVWMSSKNGTSDSVSKVQGAADISNPHGVDMPSGDGWKISGEKKNKNKLQGNSLKQWSTSSSSGPKAAWGQPDTVQRLGLRNPGGSGGRGSEPRAAAKQPQPVQPSDDSDEYDDELEDDSDAELMSDDFDTDETPQDHETRKQSRCFKDFFKTLDSCSIEQLNDVERQWHCPVCQRGAGAIDWFRGLQPLLTHAKTKISKRPKLHQEFAALLEEELRTRGASAVPPAGEVFGKWKGLEESDKEIVWPPMVIIMNTRLEKDDNDKWTGMGSRELLEYFSSFSASRARHSYGPMGHRGKSVLIFEPSAVGYAEAERLSRHFQDTGRDREAWNRTKIPVFRQLYGYMAEKQDLESFNQHSPGKSRLKYEMKSYKEMVVNQLKQMNEDNQKLAWYKNRAVNEKMSKIALQDSFVVLTEKLRQTTEENLASKLRYQKHHELNKQAMDFHEEFLREQLQRLCDAENREEEGRKSEKVAHQNEGDSNNKVVVAAILSEGGESSAEYVKKMEILVKSQEERKLDMQRRHHEEMMALEKEFVAELNGLTQEYSPQEEK